MKTTTYLATVLALIIQVMVKGQTPNHQSAASSGKILHDISAKKVSAEQNASPLTELIVLQRQSDSLMTLSLQLREESKTLSESAKKEVLAESYKLYKQSEVMQLRLSRASEKIMKEQFNTNVTGYNALLELSFASEAALSKAILLFSEAQRAMRLAEELREEANALPVISQTLGSMNNAEEKEWIAVKKSGEAINLLRTASVSPLQQGIAVK
ncbi:MAG: hypothetical protein ACXVPQ_04950 [Bacteroidia bacterium]